MGSRKKGRNVNQFFCITKNTVMDTIFMIYKGILDTIQIHKTHYLDTIRCTKMPWLDTFNINYGS